MNIPPHDTKKTISIDFDGVIHDYREGWKDGSIYGKATPRAFEAIKLLLMRGYRVYIQSARSAQKIQEWLLKQPECDPMLDGSIPVQLIPADHEFWDTEGVLGVSNRKMASVIYIDDRAYHFDRETAPESHWEEILSRFP